MDPHLRALEATVRGVNVILRSPESQGQQDWVAGCEGIRESCPCLLGRQGEIAKCNSAVRGGGQVSCGGTVVGDMAAPFQESFKKEMLPELGKPPQGAGVCRASENRRSGRASGVHKGTRPDKA